MRELTGEAEDDASCAASGVNERDQRTIPPAWSLVMYDLLLQDSTFV
jgi:hypothetical protein